MDESCTDDWDYLWKELQAIRPSPSMGEAQVMAKAWENGCLMIWNEREYETVDRRHKDSA